MHLNIDFNRLSPDIAKISIRKLRLHAFFWSRSVAQWCATIAAQGNASAPKTSKMTLSRQLLVHDMLKSQG
jgi:hypothetical protein